MPEKLSSRQVLHMRKHYVGKSCKIHYAAAPVRIERASKQYMYDENGDEYLDCMNGIAHVGHCHPHVVRAGQEQMSQLGTCQGFITDHLSLYAKMLTETLPDRLCVCYFLNSGSEANDLALRMARAYTKHEDVMVIDNAYHGNIGSCLDISPMKLKKLNQQPNENVHIIPCPDGFRGKYRYEEDDIAGKYAGEVYRAISKVHGSGRKIAAFMHEAVMSCIGVIVPPKDYLKQVYRFIREAGGVCIADEIMTGMGRTGEYWSFQTQGVVPDIVTCGKPMGNGHPLAAVITTQEIADSLAEFSTGCGGNPVSCAIGIAVLDVIKNEKLLCSAKNVGRTLIEGIKAIQPKHPMLGDVRGMGLMVGVEIVEDKESRRPAKDVAELLCYKIKQEKVLLNSDGPDKNVLVIVPPMCFTCDNAHTVIRLLDKHLTEIECGKLGKHKLEEATGSVVNGNLTDLTIPLDVVIDSDLSPTDAKKPRFEDLD